LRLVMAQVRLMPMPWSFIRTEMQLFMEHYELLQAAIFPWAASRQALLRRHHCPSCFSSKGTMLPSPTHPRGTSVTGESSFILVRQLLVVSILCLSVLGLLASSPIPTSKPSAYPAWWFQRDAIARLNPTNSSPAWPGSYPTSDDYTAINQGQFKNFAAQAYNELHAQAPTNVWSTTQGVALSNLVTGWNPTNGDGYAGVNLGQLKTVAKPFYDVLTQIGYSSGYPWTGSGADDYAAANIGQAKNVFKFDVGYDSDTNGLPDWWEMYYFGSLGNSASAQSAAGDGYSNLQEYQLERNPTNYYSGTPTLTIVSGNNQSVAPNAFASSALVVQVKNSSGTPLVAAPVTFSIASGSSGAISATSGGSTFATLTVLSDGSGDATIYYQGGPEVLKTNTITVTATNTSVTTSFTANCGISGLSLWLKADDASSLTSTNLVNGCNISGWADETGNYPVTQSTAAHQPTYVASDVNGKPAIRLNGSQWLYNSSNMSLNADMTIITIAATSSPNSQQYALWLGSGVVAEQSRSIGYYSSAQIFDTYYTNAAGFHAPDANIFVADVATLDSTVTHVAFYRNGSSSITGTLSGVQNLTSGITLGDFVGHSFGWQGDIAEVLVYSRKLNATELQQVGVYLADKYGLYNPNATWPWAYSTAVQSEITRNQWNKSQTDAYVTFLTTNPPVPPTGLVEWLRADVTSSITYSSGTSVSGWADQSPNGNNAVQSSSGNQPTLVSSSINSRPALNFSGSSYLSITDRSSLRPTDGITMLAVYRQNNTSTYEKLISKPYFNSGWSTAPYISYEMDSASSGANVPDFAVAVAGTGTGVAGASAVSVSTPTLLSGEYDGSSVRFYINGVLDTYHPALTGPIDSGNNMGKDLFIGMRSNYSGASGEWFNGNIAEILIYNRALTDGERHQAENYLINKYNTDGNHLLLSITPAPGSYSSTQTIAITGGTGIRYTIDGTTPTASSPTYASFSLSQSALVQAATFASGVATSAITSAQYYINDSSHTGLGPVPSSVAVSTSTVGELDLSWTLSGQVTYSSINIYRSTAGGAYQLIATRVPGTTTYADVNVVAGTNYQYKVGTSNQSGVANSSATTSTSPTAPSTVGITVTTPSTATNVP
jgi:hypothetical protein